ncbi:MAG: hypothetical protein S4CHLAM7_09470 [Chlamydiae bacterium]|nr:hypothetical protein [Chlamydiota bacterium]
MNLYLVVVVFSFALIFLLIFLRRGYRRKYHQKEWLERVESIARDNHTVWTTHLPDSQREKIYLLVKELQKSNLLEKRGVDLENNWVSKADILIYPQIRRLFKKLLPQILTYSLNLGLDPKLLTLSVWASIRNSEFHEMKHAQNDALFSGCYCLKGKVDPGESREGLFFYKKNTDNHLLARFNPQPGDLILYPSDMEQKEIANREAIEQVYLAFDIHFGTRTKSWLISDVAESEDRRGVDPFHELTAKANFSKHSSNLEETSNFFHISQIKKQKKTLK